MTYTATPTTNMQPDTHAGRLTEADLDARQDERTKRAYIPAGCDQQGRLDDSEADDSSETYYDDWLGDLLANAQTWAAIVVGLALLCMAAGFLYGSGANRLLDWLRTFFTF